jgi:hypothetical protein
LLHIAFCGKNSNKGYEKQIQVVDVYNIDT